MAKEDSSSPSLRVVQALEALGQAQEPQTPQQLNTQLGLPKQSLYRLIKVLETEGLVEREPGTKALRPARRARMLSNGLLAASSVHIVRRQILSSLAEEVGETVNFVRPEADGMFYLDRVETDWAFRIQLPIGTHVPFHCTASGKTYLAHLRSGDRRRILRSLTLSQKTENTITTVEALENELTEIRRVGYALDREEFMQDMIAMAVPVLDLAGRYAASLAFHGPVQRLSVEFAVTRKDILTKAAEQLSRALFA